MSASEKKQKGAKPSGSKAPLRYWLIGLFAMLLVGFVASGVFGLVSDSYLGNGWYWVAQAFLVIGTLGTFILSIVHLVKYQEKGFAVTALVVASIFLLILLLSFMIGLFIGYFGGANPASAASPSIR